MASEQLARKDDAPSNNGGQKSISQFESSQEAADDRAKSGNKASETKEKGSQSKPNSDKVRDKEQQPSLEEISCLREAAQRNSAEAISVAQERYEKAKETVHQESQKAREYVAEKGSEAKHVAVEKGQQGYETAKDTLNHAMDYAKEKAVVAKDATVEGGKEAVHYAGHVAVEVKDKANVAGWTAVHYTTEKAVDGTKAAASSVQEAADYVGHKAAEIVSPPLGLAKEKAAAAGEIMKEYTAMKKEEAEKEAEARKTAATEKQDTERSYQGVAEGQQHQQDEKGGSVLEAIGETIDDIARTTKEMVIGQDQPTGPQEAAGTGARETGGAGYVSSLAEHAKNE